MLLKSFNATATSYNQQQEKKQILLLVFFNKVSECALQLHTYRCVCRYSPCVTWIILLNGHATFRFKFTFRQYFTFFHFLLVNNLCVVYNLNSKLLSHTETQIKNQQTTEQKNTHVFFIFICFGGSGSEWKSIELQKKKKKRCRLTE